MRGKHSSGGGKRGEQAGFHEGAEEARGPLAEAEEGGGGGGEGAGQGEGEGWLEEPRVEVVEEEGTRTVSVEVAEKLRAELLEDQCRRREVEGRWREVEGRNMELELRPCEC